MLERQRIGERNRQAALRRLRAEDELWFGIHGLKLPPSPKSIIDAECPQCRHEAGLADENGLCVVKGCGHRHG